MIELKVNKPIVSLTLDNKVNLTFITQKSVLSDLEALTSDELALTIKEYHQKRTLTQNAYFWKLVNALAEKLGDKSESVYKTFIRDYGVRDVILLQNKVVDEFLTRWTKKGMGWFAEPLRKGKIDETTTMLVYYGSSTYNTKEMARLIDGVVQECEEQGIPTLTDDQFRKLKNENDEGE